MKKFRFLASAFVISLLAGCDNGAEQTSLIKSIEITKDSTNIEELEVLVGDTFKLDSLVNDNLEVICFEISARTDGGTNTFMDGSPYSYLTYGKPMSMGRRIALEIKNGIERDELEKIIT